MNRVSSFKAGAAATFAAFVLSALPSFAAISVNNYSWLQLPPNEITSFALNSSQTPITGTQFGAVDSFRWNFRTWIPTLAQVGNGTTAGSGYYAGLTFDQPRNITNVTTRWFLTSTATLSHFIIEGSTDGINFSQIGTQTYGSPQTGDGTTTSVSVTPGSYKTIRVKVAQGDYTATAAGFDVPGLWGIQPFSGSTTISEGEANYVNNPVFGTTATSNLSNPSDARNGGGWNNGILSGNQNQNGQQGTWSSPNDPTAPDYAQVDLGTARDIGRVVVAWQHAGDGGQNFNVQYSTDGVHFFYVSHLSSAIIYAPGSGVAATEHDFAGVTARFLRITDVIPVGGSPTTSYTLFTEVLAFTGTPEPASMAILGLGGLAMLRRRR